MGRYDRYITVIGDKRGGITTKLYHKSPQDFKLLFKMLEKMVGIPIKAIHCARNPYDMVSTNMIYKVRAELHNKTSVLSLKSTRNSDNNTMSRMKSKLDNELILESAVNLFKSQSNAVMEITELLGADNVLELHNHELVEDPKSVLTKMCAFVEVECSPEYINMCSSKVFKSVSRSRDLVVWSERLRSEMERVINNHPTFHRYSFS